MIKAFLKDSIVYTLPALFSRGIGILLLPIYTRIASPEELGALDLFIAFGNIVTIIVAFEITQGISRYIPNADKLAGKYAFIGLIFTAITYSLAMFLLVYYSDSISQLLTRSDEYKFEFLLALSYITCNAFYYYFQNLLRFSGRSVQFAISSSIYAGLNLSFAFTFGFILNLSLSGILFALLFSSLLSAFISLLFLRSYFEITFNIEPLAKLLKFSIPLIPSSILVILSLYIDRFFINYFLGIESVGVYSIAIKVASVSSLLIIGFQMALTPLIYKHYKSPETPRDLSLIFKYFSIFALIFFMAFSIFSNNILILLTSPSFYGASEIIPGLVLAFFFSQMYVFMPGILIVKKTYLVLFINIAITTLNIIFNIILIPGYELFGAAASKAISYFIGFLFFIFFSQKYYFVEHDWRKLVINLFLSLLLVLIYFNYFQYLETYFAIAFKITLIGLLLISIYLTGLLKAEDLFKIERFIFQRIKTRQSK